MKQLVAFHAAPKREINAYMLLLSSDCPLLHSSECSTLGMVPPILDRSSHLSQTNQDNNNPQQECLETHRLDSRVSQVGW